MENEQLGLIKVYDLKDGPIPLVKMLREIWHWPDYFKYADGFLELHTGGWSGNEDTIEVLEGTMFWFFFWQRSERGGHYYFEIPELNLGINVQSVYFHYSTTPKRMIGALQKAQLEGMGIRLIFIQEANARSAPIYYVKEALAGREHP